MPKFDASSVSDVEFDFSGWKGIKGSPYEGQPINEKGVVPEPSGHLVGETMSRITEAFNRMDMGAEVPEIETQEQLKEALTKISDADKFNAMSDELYAALGDLCQGEPSMDALTSLGWRRFMAFLGYLMQELMSPEAETAGSSNTPAKRLRSV